MLYKCFVLLGICNNVFYNYKSLFRLFQGILAPTTTTTIINISNLTQLSQYCLHAPPDPSPPPTPDTRLHLHPRQTLTPSTGSRGHTVITHNKSQFIAIATVTMTTTTDTARASTSSAGSDRPSGTIPTQITRMCSWTIPVEEVLTAAAECGTKNTEQAKCRVLPCHFLSIYTCRLSLVTLTTQAVVK